MPAVTILGAGNMARGIGTVAVAGGNPVQILARDKAAAEGLAADLGSGVVSGAIGDAISGEIVVLAVPYPAAGPLVEQHREQLAGKVVVDITNPVDFETFDRLVTPADSSAAQEIAKASPDDTPVVKAFNTTFASTLVAREVGGEPLDVFIAGDDDSAKAAVARIVEAGGLRPVDVGPLHVAHWLEGMGFLHMGAQSTLGRQFDTAMKLLG